MTRPEHTGAPLVGQQFGPYAITSLLGAGGMGEVYRARDTRLGRDVAIKILPEIFTADPDRRARSEREARLLASLNRDDARSAHLAAGHGWRVDIENHVWSPRLARLAHPTGFAVSADARSVHLASADTRPLATEIVSIADAERIERPLVAALVKAVQDGVTVHPRTLHDAIRFAQSLPTDWPTPEIVVEKDGDIAFDWILDSRRVLTAAVGPRGKAGYSALVGYEPTYGQCFLTDEIPSTISELMRRIRMPPTWQTP